MKEVLVKHWEAQGQVFARKEDAQFAEFRAFLMDVMGHYNEDSICFLWEHRKQIINFINELEKQ